MVGKIDELIETRTREELDEMATNCGIDPSKFSNKPALAREIIRAERGKERAEKVTGKREYAKTSVSAKRDANEKAAKNMEAGVKEIHADIKAQVKENEEAVKKIESGVKEIETGMEKKAKEIETGAKEIETDIEAHARENEKYIKEFYYG